MGMSALMIPELPTHPDAVEIDVRPTAHDHPMARDATQCPIAIHEAGHVCAAAVSATAVGATIAGSLPQASQPGTRSRAKSSMRGRSPSSSTIR